MANHRQGLPYASCPEDHSDAFVKHGIYDLFLCASCEKACDEASHKRGKSTKKSGKTAPASRLVKSVQPGKIKLSDVIRSDDNGAAGQLNYSAESGCKTAINELLSYVGLCRNRSNIEAFRRTALSFYDRRVAGETIADSKIPIAV